MSRENRSKTKISVNFDNCTIGKVNNFESSQNINIYSEPQYVYHGSHQNREISPIHHQQLPHTHGQHKLQPFQFNRPPAVTETINQRHAPMRSMTTRDVNMPSGGYSSIHGFERQEVWSSRNMVSSNDWDQPRYQPNRQQPSRLGREYAEGQHGIFSEIPIDQQSMASCLQESNSWSDNQSNSRVNPNHYGINPRYKQPTQNYHSFLDDNDDSLAIHQNTSQNRKEPIEIDETEEGY